MKKRAFKILQIVSLFAGLALFVYLIQQTGLDTLGHYLGMMGWGALAILALSAARNYARAGSWYFSIEPAHRNVGFHALTNVMLAGEAIKYLTTTGPFLSEPAKAAMVRRQVPMLQGVSSVVVENIIYYLTVFVVMLAGLPALVWLADVPDRLKVAGYMTAGVVIMSLLITWAAIRWRWYVFARLLGFAAGRKPLRGRAGLQKAVEQTRKVEDNIYSFYEQRRGAFYLVFALNMAAHLINVVEVYLILALMKLPASISAGFVIEAATKLINMAFFFVPARAGVYESGNALILDALGMSAGAGVALAIIRKVRAFFWVGYGLAVIGWVVAKDRRGHVEIQANRARMNTEATDFHGSERR